jgi:UDP-GlcNAc:undecaprenyl-phosphate/decaprenyl-phosphate GlcNAc-1-phosphate transferase
MYTLIIENFNLILILILNLILINLLIKKLPTKKLIDYPNEYRKIHNKPVLKIGGLVLILNFISFYLFDDLQIINFPLFVFIIFIFLIGFFDDLYNLNPYLRIFLMAIFMFIFIMFEQNFILQKIYFETFQEYKNLGIFSLFFTIFCIVVIINAFNLFDGINGLSLSYFIIIFLYLSLKFQETEFIPIIFICMILIYYNLRNKIFLGDSGVYILSTLLGLSLIKTHNIANNLFSAENIFLLLMVPGIDMMRVFFERVLNRKMFFTPDKNHLHHIFLRKFGETKTLYFLISFLIFPIIPYEANFLPAYIIIFLSLLAYVIIISYFKSNAKN